MSVVLVHNMMMTGPPGAGKTLLARSVPSILPGPTMDEAFDLTRIFQDHDDGEGRQQNDHLLEQRINGLQIAGE